MFYKTVIFRHIFTKYQSSISILVKMYTAGLLIEINMCSNFSGQLENIKGTLMKIWKFHYIIGFILKQYPEIVAFLILRVLELFTREVSSY